MIFAYGKEQRVPVLNQPCPRLQRIGADRKPEEDKTGDQESGKEDAGDGGGTRRL